MSVGVIHSFLVEYATLQLTHRGSFGDPFGTGGRKVDANRHREGGHYGRELHPGLAAVGSMMIIKVVTNREYPMKS